MNFTDILNLFRQGKSSARSHIKNLIEMAAADGVFDLLEHDLLQKIAQRNNVSEAHLKNIHDDASDIQFELPADRYQRFSQFYDLVHMMTVDKSIHPEEMKLCNLFAIKFGYPRIKANEIIETIQSNIRHGQNADETFKRVEWMLN